MRIRWDRAFLVLCASSMPLWAGNARAQSATEHAQFFLAQAAQQNQEQQQQQEHSALKQAESDLAAIHRDLYLAFRKSQRADGAFLGVNVEPPADALRSQLKLPEGVGLIVNFLADDGPAKQAGLRVHDVLQKLDDQLLVNAEQLVALVRLKKTGDEVKLTFLREAKPATLTLKLGQRNAQRPEEPRGAGDAGAGETYAGLFSTSFGSVFHPVELRDVNLVARSTVVGPMTLDDGENVIVVTRAGEGSMIVINKESGKVVFEGPTKTEEQWKAVPEGVRKKLEVLKALQPAAAGDSFFGTYLPVYQSLEKSKPTREEPKKHPEE